MESVNKSGGGSAPGGGAGAGAGAEGVLCHACGYQYPNGHPSAKQRRAHRKHCGKPASADAAAAVAEGEHDGAELLLGEGSGGAGASAGGDGAGAGASATERGGGGGGLPGSAQDAANAVEGGGDSVEHSSGNGAGYQGIGDKSAEECLISSSNIPPEITTEACRTDDDTITTVAAQYSEKGSPIESRDPSDPPAGPEHPQDVPTSVISPEPEDCAKFSSDTSEHETQNSTVVVLESDATGGGSSEQMNDAVRQVDGIAVTDEDDTMNTIGKNKSSEDKSVEADEFGLSCQDNRQTDIDEGHSSTALEEDSADKNLNMVHNEEIPGDDAEPNQPSKDVLTDSFEKIHRIEEPAESSTEKSAGIDDGFLRLGVGGSHTETSDADDVKPQQQPVSTSETAELLVSKGANNVDEQHYPISEGSLKAISSAIEPAVGDKVISVGGEANFTDTICSFDLTNVTISTVLTSQVDPMELSTSATTYEINMVDSTNDDDDKRRNEIVGIDLTSSEVGDMNIIENFEEKQHEKEDIVSPFPHEVNAVASTDNHLENEQSEEITADTTSCIIRDVQSMNITEEKEQIEEFIANLASEVINVTSSRDMVEEKKQDEIVKTNHAINEAQSMEATGENNATMCDTDEGTVTDYVEDEMANVEIITGTSSHDINMVDNSIDEEKMRSKEVTGSLGPHGNIVFVEEKIYEDVTAGPTPDKLSLSTSTDSVEERKDEKTSADPTSHEANVTPTTDNSDEEKYWEADMVPTSSINSLGFAGDAEDKKHSEETAADPESNENATTTQHTDDVENSKQNVNTTTIAPSSDEAAVAQMTNVVEEREMVEDTASKEISTIESTDDLKGATDQNEEIADKEMVTDSDKNHVSLKALLADKNVETKEREKKTSAKDRVLSFRRLVSKDNVSPVKPGSPKAGSEQQDWNSPARLPVEKKSKGRKQQWVPFICCSSVQ